MANTLTIRKETGDYFGFELSINGVAQDKVINMRNDVFAIGNICHFKTSTGANIIKSQNVSVFDITLIASGSFTFTDINVFLAKLIDVGFYDWLLGGGGGTGTDRFDELLDTFDYFGNDMKAVRVNESQLKLEPFTVYNYRKIVDLEDTFATIVPNKMLATNALGTAVELRDIPAEPEQFLNAVGTFHYADLATLTTPLNIVANVPKKLENDTLGDYTIISNAPYGVSGVWNPATNQLNFTQLSLGDMLVLRVDALIITDSANQTLKCYVKMGLGSLFEFDLILAQAQIKNAGSYPFIAEVNFDLAYEEIIDNPAEIYILSDGNGSIAINGWYIEVIRKNINIVSIETNIHNDLTGLNDGDYQHLTVAEKAIALTVPTIDATPTDGSTNAVQSNGVFGELALKAPLASPALTGTPTAPTAAPATNTTQIATTAFVLANGGAVTEAQIATINHAATAKTVLVDADEVTGQDSTDTFALIRTVWGDVWTYIKSKADTYYQPKGIRITNATTTGSYAVDWNAADVWQLTLTGATTITDTNLPTGTATKVIEFLITGAFAWTPPAYWVELPSSQAYDGAKQNHVVISCINGTTSSELVYYSNETTT